MFETILSEEYRALRQLHQETFDRLADEYSRRYEDRRQRELFLLGPLSMYLRQTFRSGEDLSILDIGCGVGGSCALLTQEGFRTVGIDISTKMLSHARMRSPTTEYVEGDFLEADFPPHSFHGVCAKAVLHLFEEDYARFFLTKVRSQLVDKGGLFVAVARGPDQPGSIQEKEDYPGKPLRFRRNWSAERLNALLSDVGFSPVFWAQQEDDNKSWVDCWAIKISAR